MVVVFLVACRQAFFTLAPRQGREGLSF